MVTVGRSSWNESRQSRPSPRLVCSRYPLIHTADRRQVNVKMVCKPSEGRVRGAGGIAQWSDLRPEDRLKAYLKSSRSDRTLLEGREMSDQIATTSSQRHRPHANEDEAPADARDLRAFHKTILQEFYQVIFRKGSTEPSKSSRKISMLGS